METDGDSRRSTRRTMRMDRRALVDPNRTAGAQRMRSRGSDSDAKRSFKIVTAVIPIWRDTQLNRRRRSKRCGCTPKCPRYATNDDTATWPSMKWDLGQAMAEVERATSPRTVCAGGAEAGKEIARPS